MPSPFTRSFWGGSDPVKQDQFRRDTQEGDFSVRALQLRRMGLDPNPFLYGGPGAAQVRGSGYFPGTDPNRGEMPFTAAETEAVFAGIDRVQPPGYPATITRGKRPTADELSVLIHPDTFASPDFDRIAERWTGKSRAVAPGTQIVEGTRVVHENPPLAANTGPGAALRNPRTGELISQNAYGPRTVGEGGEVVTLDASGNPIARVAGPPKTYAPGTGQPKPVDPLVAANRMATLEGHARKNVMLSEGIIDTPFGGLVDLSTNAPPTADKMQRVESKLQAEVSRLQGAAPTERRSAPTLDSTGPAALPPGAGVMPDGADRDNGGYSPAGSPATDADADRAREEAGGDPQRAISILMARGLRLE